MPLQKYLTAVYISPSFNMELFFWDSSTEFNGITLENVQRKSLRFAAYLYIKNTLPTLCKTNICKFYKLPSLADCWLLQVISFLSYLLSGKIDFLSLLKKNQI